MPSANKEIRYGTDLHRRVLDALMSRWRLSDNEFSRAHDNWKRSEEQYLAYLPEKETDRLRRQKREGDGEPQITTLVVPYSYAVHMSQHTYLTSVFLSRTPVLQFDGLHGQGEQQVQAVDAVMNYQTVVGEHLVPYYVWLLDVGKYGLGMLGNHWDKDVKQIAEIKKVPKTFLGRELPGTERSVMVRREVVGYEGNRLFNIRPYDAFPDPRVSLTRYQEGEFFILVSDLGWNDILSGDYFNKKWVEKFRADGFRKDDGSSQMDIPSVSRHLNPVSEIDLADVGRIDIWECYVRLVPSQWGLDEFDQPELWVFEVANGKVIIGARPVGAIHDRFPVQVQEYEPGVYQLTRRSLHDIMRPLQNVMDWLVNSHLYNVRKAINDMLIVDPSLVSVKDLMDPLPGKMVRMLPAGYGGQFIDRAVKQLGITDVTQQHFGSLEYIAQMIQRATGVTDTVMGQMETGGRRTATETRTTTTFGVNRLKTQAEWMSAQAWGPLAQMMIQNTQQYLDRELVLRIAGDYIKHRGAERFITVTPEDIAGQFEFMPVDGTFPVDRFAQANLWREMMKTAAAIPGVMERYDWGGIFGWVAQLSGLKNVKQFEVQMVPDEQVADEVRSGNVVGLEEARGDRAIVGGTEEIARVPEPGQIAGLGTTG